MGLPTVTNAVWGQLQSVNDFCHPHWTFMMRACQHRGVCRHTYIHPYCGSLFVITRKGVPERRGPALVCLSDIDKKTVYWSFSWARILNVQDIIKEITKETRSNISSTCIPSTTIAGAGQHSSNTCLRCTSYRGCGPTHQILVQCWASIAAHCWFNAGQSSTTLAQH